MRGVTRVAASTIDTAHRPPPSTQATVRRRLPPAELSSAAVCSSAMPRSLATQRGFSVYGSVRIDAAYRAGLKAALGGREKSI